MPTKAKTARGKFTKPASLDLRRLTANQLNTATKTFVSAAQAGRVKEMAEALAPEFSFIDERGAVFMAAACMEGLTTKTSNPPPDFRGVPRLTVNSFKVGEVNTQKFGETVVETMVYTDNVTVRQSATSKVTTFDRSFRWTNIWVARNGGYKLALTQLTPIQWV